MIIILIHGTNAPNAPWTKPGSLFRRELEGALDGPDSIEQLAFVWSGRNRHVARRRASLQLRRLITLKLSQEPHSNIYLVAHSHGGNIAVQAARHFVAEPRVAGVVTLATPFLEFSESPPAVTLIGPTFQNAFLMSLIFALYWAGIFGLSVLAYVTIGPFLLDVMRFKAWVFSQLPLCSALLGSALCSRSLAVISSVVAGLYALIFVTGLVYYGYLSAESDRDAQVEKTRRSISRYFYFQPLEAIQHLKILSLSAPTDEALQALNGSWWAHRVNIWAGRIIGGLAISGALVALAAVLTGVIAYVQANRFAPDQAIVTTLLLCGTFSIAVPLVFVATALLARLINLVGSIPAPALGLSVGERSLLWSVHARRTLPPTNNHCHRVYGWRDLLFGAGGGLMHSRLYRSVVAIREIAAWLAARETERQAAR